MTEENKLMPIVVPPFDDSLSMKYVTWWVKGYIAALNTMSWMDTDGKTYVGHHGAPYGRLLQDAIDTVQRSTGVKDEDLV